MSQNIASSKTCIIQHGVDGFGHQLHGLFSTLILHNVRDFYFDGDAYCKKWFVFQHISEDESCIMKEYLMECMRGFTTYFNQSPIAYDSLEHVHEVYNIPQPHATVNVPQPHAAILYSLDNAYYFDKIGLSQEEKTKHAENICHFKSFFKTKHLTNRLDSNNIVIHVRLGDAMAAGRGNSILMYNSKMNLLLDKLSAKYPNHTIYLHSDGTPDFLKDCSYVFFGKTTPLIDVLSDLIHSKILVCGDSSLSQVSAFLGDHELVIVGDDTAVSIPSNAQKISEYLSE